VARARIKGLGLYAPGEPIDNEELVELTGIEMDREKLEQGLGIKQRHIAKLRGIDESTADFATRAGEEALQDAGVDAADVGLFIVGTDTPEYITPGTAMLVQGRMQGGQTNAGAFDISTSCAGYVTALDVGSRIMAADPSVQYALIIGVYNMPAYVKEGDSFGYSIFADGAAATVIEKQDDASPGYIQGQYVADGTQYDYIGVYAGGTRKPITHELLDKGEYGLQLLQRLPGDRNVKLWPPLVHRLLEKAELSLEQIDHILFTQINRSVIQKVMGILELPMEKTTTIMDRYGYTGSACVPMAFYHAVKEGRVQRGDTVMLVASGAGLAVASSVFVY
jgi:3-oxoacyl-[acyl-carrier-protein] synthase-3